jgi:hypothetical protein
MIESAAAARTSAVVAVSIDRWPAPFASTVASH